MKSYRIWVVGLLVIVGAVWAVWYLRTPEEVRTVEEAVPEASVPAEGSAIYTNGEYGFALIYPDGAMVEDTFTASYHLAPSWRANALATGTPIVSIVTYTTESDSSYPRYFHTMVRIGASEDPKEVAACEKPTQDQGEVQEADTTINGVPFKTFSFQNAGMMQYVKGVSYRTMHEGACIALEKIQAGSSYREDAPSASDIPDETLRAEYAALDAVVQSFTFARP